MNIPRHPIERRMFLPIFPKSKPGQLQKKYATAWEITKDIIREMVNAHFADNLGMISVFCCC